MCLIRMHAHAANKYYLIEKLHHQKINFETVSVLNFGQLLTRREVDLEVRSLHGPNLNLRPSQLCWRTKRI